MQLFFCAQCGQPLRYGAQFCNKCGIRIEVVDLDATTYVRSSSTPGPSIPVGTDTPDPDATRPATQVLDSSIEESADAEQEDELTDEEQEDSSETDGVVPSFYPIWTQCFIWRFVATAVACLIATFSALGGVPLWLSFSFICGPLIVLAFISTRSIKSRYLQLGFALQVGLTFTSLASLLFVSANPPSLRTIVSGPDSFGYIQDYLSSIPFYFLVAESLLNAGSLVCLSYGIRHRLTFSSNRVFFPIVICVGVAMIFLFLVLGSANSNEPDLVAASIIAIIFSLLFIFPKLAWFDSDIFPWPKWRDYPSVVLSFFTSGAILFFLYQVSIYTSNPIDIYDPNRDFIVPASTWLIFAQTPILLGLLLLVQIERVQMKVQEITRLAP